MALGGGSKNKEVIFAKDAICDVRGLRHFYKCPLHIVTREVTLRFPVCLLSLSAW